MDNAGRDHFGSFFICDFVRHETNAIFAKGNETTQQ
jgi:hypothetical protein